MLVAKQVLEWQAIAEVKTRRADLLRALEVHCGSPAPAEIIRAVESSSDPGQLTQWFDIALRVQSYDEFRAALNP
jgi:hypothetical protein